MYLRKAKNKNTGRTYLSIVKSYRDSTGKPVAKVIESIGYADDFEHLYDDPIAHFEEVARLMTIDEKKDRFINITIDKDKEIDKDSNETYNLGFVILSLIYHELELHEFFANRTRYRNFKYNINAIARLLIFSRILHPNSKKKTFEDKDRYFEKFKFSLNDVYESLEVFASLNDELIKWVNTRVKNQYKLDTETLYYDVTNYFFSSDSEDDLRKKGFSKENRRTPIIQMGLVTDGNGIPITYKLFPGNTHDASTYAPVFSDVKKEFKSKRIIIVADKALNSGDNIAYTTIENNGYLFGQKIKGASKNLINFALNQDDYTITQSQIVDNEEVIVYKYKERVIPTEINVSSTEIKSKRKVVVDQKQIVFFSLKYAKKAKLLRLEKIAKAQELINNPSLYNNSTNKGAYNYIKDIVYNAETGEIDEVKSRLVIDEEKIREEEKYDGYYAIVSSELDRDALDLINMYHNLWIIEDTFKVSKSDIETRPIYVFNEESIRAHFLICYISILIIRLIQVRSEGKYSAARLREILNNINGASIGHNLFRFNYRDADTEYLSDKFKINLLKENLSRADIRSLIAETKK